MKVKTLLIDLGNTALKWALLGDERTPHTVVHRGQSGFKEQLYSDWLELAPDRVIGCTVAAPELAFQQPSSLMITIFPGTGFAHKMHL